MKKGISLITLIIFAGFIIFFIGFGIYTSNNIRLTKLSKDRSNLISAYNIIVMDDLMNEAFQSNEKETLSLKTLARKVGRSEEELSKNFKIGENGNLLEKVKVKGKEYKWVEIAIKPIKDDAIIGKIATTPDNWNTEGIVPRYVRNIEKMNVKTKLFKDGGDYAIIPVPEGFVVSTLSSENDLANGVVIYEGNDNVTTDNHDEAVSTRNQFVWVPIDEDKVKYERVDWNDNKNLQYSKWIDTDALPEGFTEEKVKESILKYQGFYISRYEAGDNDTLTERNENSSGSNSVILARDNYVYNYINYNDANEMAKSVVNNDNVKSGLVTGEQWDTTLNFIKNYGIKDEKYTSNSLDNGNYSDNDYSNDPARTGDSKYNEYKFNNIFDMAGNVSEWTNEINRISLINRGGSYLDSDLVTYRDSNNSSYLDSNIGFRVSLYIK